jgi:aminoglycoside phosphotransferase (APT) family kinase protein
MMRLGNEQLQTIVQQAYGDQAIRELQMLNEQHYTLELANGERFAVLLFDTAQQAESCAQALRMLRGEFDLPIPQLRASETSGTLIGQPYVLVDALRGQPLSQVAATLSEEQRYQIGQQLGSSLQRVHRLACDRYGDLLNPEQQANSEYEYGIQRLERELAQGHQLGTIAALEAQQLRAWFEQQFRPLGKQAALVCGGISADTIWVSQQQGAWRLSGLLGWQQAIAWSPAWEHSTVLDSLRQAEYFSLRVGYGNAYDEQTARTYEQVRERALVPYRILLALGAMNKAAQQGDTALVDHERKLVRSLIDAPSHSS